MQGHWGHPRGLGPRCQPTSSGARLTTQDPRHRVKRGLCGHPPPPALSLPPTRHGAQRGSPQQQCHGPGRWRHGRSIPSLGAGHQRAHPCAGRDAHPAPAWCREGTRDEPGFRQPTRGGHTWGKPLRPPLLPLTPGPLPVWPVPTAHTSARKGPPASGTRTAVTSASRSPGTGLRGSTAQKGGQRNSGHQCCVRTDRRTVQEPRPSHGSSRACSPYREEEEDPAGGRWALLLPPRTYLLGEPHALPASEG